MKNVILFFNTYIFLIYLTGYLFESMQKTSISLAFTWLSVTLLTNEYIEDSSLPKALIFESLLIQALLWALIFWDANKKVLDNGGSLTKVSDTITIIFLILSIITIYFQKKNK